MAENDTTETSPKRPRRTLDARAASDPDTIPGAETGTVVIRNAETGGVAIVPRYGYENGWRFHGWDEVDTEAEREELLAQAKEEGVAVRDDATGRYIVQAMISHRNRAREEV